MIISFAAEGKQINISHDATVGAGCYGCIRARDHQAYPLQSKIWSTLQASCDEFFEMGKYFIIGAFLGAMAQTFIPRSLLLGIGQDKLASILIMLVFAFAVSVCSSADAFIAASFANSFSPGALLAFMVIGPMLDVKNTMMLFKAFKSRFVLFMTPVIIMLVIICAHIFNMWR